MTPVTFIAVLSGGRHDRARLVEALADVRDPGDETLVAVCDFAPVPAFVADRIPDGVRLVALSHAQLASAFDHLIGLASNEGLVLLGNGYAIGRPGVEAVREAMAAGPCLVDAGSAVGVARSAAQGSGGLVRAEQAARRIASGMVGTGDLFESLAHLVRRSGWPVRSVEVEVRAPALGARRVGGPPESASPPEGVGPPEDVGPPEGVGPPSRRSNEVLGRALGPTARATTQWLRPILTAEQQKALDVAVGARPDAVAAAPGTFTCLTLARQLAARGLIEPAAKLLEQYSLAEFTSPDSVGEIAVLLSNAGRPLATVLEKLRHAPSQLAEVIATRQPSAEQAFEQWWQISPDATAIAGGLALLSGSLGVAQAVVWHTRLRALPVASPLAAIRNEPRRSPVERLLAELCLRLEGVELADIGLAANQTADVIAAAERAARQLVDTAAAASSGTPAVTAVPAVPAAPAQAATVPAAAAPRRTWNGSGSDPLVSVLIPTFNRAHWLPDAIDSALGQSGVDMELIVADNVSTDGTAELVNSYARRDPRVRLVVNDENIGCYPNCAKLLGLARGRYIKYLMSDDVLLPGSLQTMATLLEDPGVSMVTCRLQEVDENLRNPRLPEWTFPVKSSCLVPGYTFGDYSLLTNTNFANCASTVMFRRGAIEPSDFARFAGVSFTYGGDYATWLTLMTQGNVAYLVEPIANMRIHAGQGAHEPGGAPVAPVESMFMTLLAPGEGYLKDPESRHQALVLVTRNLMHHATFDRRDPWTPVVLGALLAAYTQLRDLSTELGVAPSEAFPSWWGQPLEDLLGHDGVDPAQFGLARAAATLASLVPG